jgi:nitric oxide reductase NorD protein
MVSIKERILSLFPVPFYTSSRIYFEGDLEEEGVADTLSGLSPLDAERVLKAAEVLSAIKPELSLELLLSASSSQPLPEGAGPEQWAREVLDLYDSQGLLPAIDLIRRGKDHPLFMRRWGKGAYLGDYAQVLEAYVNSLGRRSVSIKEAESHYTDTSNIYLPSRISLFQDKGEGASLFKVMATCSYGRIVLGTYRPDHQFMERLMERIAGRYSRGRAPSGLSDLTRLFSLFPEPDLARDLYGLADAARVEAWIGKELPGLYRTLLRLKSGILSARKSPIGSEKLMEAVEGAFRWWLGDGDARCPEAVKNALSGLMGASVEDALEVTAECYGVFDRLQGPYTPLEPIIYMGELRAEDAERERLRRRESTRLEFRRELGKILGCLKEEKEIRISVPSKEASARSGKRGPLSVPAPAELNVDGRSIPVPEALGRVIEDIYEDLGSIPSSYLAVTDEMSGHHFTHLCEVAPGPANLLSETAEGVHAIDEWDYRRQGYRKNWALLRETPLAEGPAQWADEVLSSYGHIVSRIKRQFEFMRRERVLAKRQKDGEDIDIDAAVEALADLKAGAHPLDELFLRLERDRRDIAVAFLLDLSGSTSGWINRMERDMLLILCEALSLLRDRFAVYGFSGHTRLRCELYRIKAFDEPYDSRIKGRIMNIRAYEYTRLGAPIRYVTRLLSSAEARTRLLITLSDGKPDDYDGYRGNYGIEDTRQALLEAMRKGIHPFCITIDKAEHSYIRHMYGEANYLFLDNISSLPLKMPEIYRRLTS